MCDFKPGDEVTPIDGLRWKLWTKWWLFQWGRRETGPVHGGIYTVAFVEWFPAERMPHPDLDPRGVEGMVLAEFPSFLYQQRCFRKVERRNLTAWLATEKTIEEPKRAPDKKRERA